jgi:ATP-dependent protease ClpP protease subunit
MLQIRNSADQIEIDVFGTIGDSWFDEGITMDSIRARLTEAGDKPVILNIASLGGVVDHALVIHDLIAMHKAPTTARIMGATASAATVVAMGADRVEMSENALFLVHNARMVAAGTADDLRKDADTLDTFDERIVNVYVNATGASRRRIRELMKEDKWISPAEAKEWGFVDTVFTPAKAAAIALPVEEINASGLFPIITQTTNTMDQKSFFAQLAEDFRALFASVKPAAVEPEPTPEPEPEPEVEPTPEPTPEVEPEPDVTAQAEIEMLRAHIAERDAEIERLRATATPEAHQDKPIGKPSELTEAEKWVATLTNEVKTKHF